MTNAVDNETTDAPSVQTEIALNVQVTLTIKRVHVKGTADYPYLITMVNDAPVACTCPDLTHRGIDALHVCKHMGFVFRKMESEVGRAEVASGEVLVYVD